MAIDVSGSEQIEVVGESFYRPALQELSRRLGSPQVDTAIRASLTCDPTNPYDSNAVKVMIGGLHVGHLSRELAALVAERVATLTREKGEVECAAEIRGSDPEFGQGVVLWVDIEQLGLMSARQEEDSVVRHEQNVSVASAPVSSIEEQASRPTPSPPTASGHRRQIVERAVERWKSELIDLTARNRLLYMRDLRTGTLSFDQSARDVLMQLVAGNRVALSKLVPRSKLSTNPEAKLTPFEDSLRRMRSIVRTARSYEEERGVRTLFLACGVATWRSDRASRPPAAPVLLVPLSIKSRGASQQDFDLSLAGDLEVNPTLLHLLKVEFNLEINEQELYEHADMDGVIDTPEELRLTYNWLSERCATVRDWAISDQFTLGNFWYAKLPMVKDLENSIEALSSHDVAAALAGDKQAQQALAMQREAGAANPPSVESIPPANEFNVLDSDSSQSTAIARACGGESLVLKGPPGTGKSQTIANLICHAIGQSKRVLFVAEKRAAIEAVTKRLDPAGLRDLVLDLHQGAESRKWLAGQLDVSLHAVKTASNVLREVEESRLVRARDVLGGHVTALHMKHPPWEVSVLEAQMELIDRGRPSLNTRLRGPDLEKVKKQRLAELTDTLSDLLAMEGLSLRAKGSPWRDANVTTVDLARETVTLVEATKDLMTSFRRKLNEAANMSGLPEPPDLRVAEATVEVLEAACVCCVDFDPEIFGDDLDALLAILEPLQGSALSRFLAALTSAEFRTSRDAVLARVREGRSLEPQEIYAGLAACHQLREEWRRLGGSRVTPIPADRLDGLKASLERLGINCRRLSDLIGRDLVSPRFQELEVEIANLDESRDTAMILPAIHAARGLFAAAALEGFLTELEGHQALLPEALVELERVWWQSLADHLMMLPESEHLSAFRGERHDQVLEAFRELDRDHVAATAQRVKRIAAENAVRAQDRYPDQAQLVREQAKRKRRHLPVRELFARAPDVLTALRPCWVMSPLMVSQLIPSERAYFDLVVFDEASQVRPVEALTSMIRGTQLVVAGDNHQLPPTAFFDAATAEDGDSEKEEESTEIGDYESLLDVLMTLFDTEMLRWHYRSRDERLIGFSNQEIYESGLTTFPGVVDGDVLSHVYVDQLPGPEEARVSPDAEVRKVVELVLDHARTRPEQSLGVIALGIKHAEAIEAGLLATLPDHSDLEPFFDESREERFFVKNLERVQGDERDAIILAIGYGKQPDGTLPHRFGPLNNAGGERRLNVAVTRAKERMTVVSSFQADDLDPKRSSAEGVRLLRAFLAYASRGGDTEQPAGDRVGPNALHRLISESLRNARYQATELIGTSADQIDIAVVDPDRGVPRVAIEIDGPLYARRPSVRDRDRLRSEQLERLGWRYIATWSQDWWRDPAGTAQRLAGQVAAALSGGENDGGGEPVPSAVPPAVPPPAPDRGARPALSSGGVAITDWRLNDLVKLAKWIESDGMLRTAEELERELMQELGITRRGSRVARVLEEVVASLRSPR